MARGILKPESLTRDARGWAEDRAIARDCRPSRTSRGRRMVGDLEAQLTDQSLLAA